MNNNKKSGFTLVELAIVLVIIGLIIGGVLVGQDLIKAATIRATVTDIEKFNAAATTFRGKYNGLPGDLAAPKAVQFAFSGAADANATGAAGLRDGNGVIEGGSAANANYVGGETTLFWQDLGKAALIGGSYTGAGTAIYTAVTAANVNTFLPKAKLRDSAAFHTYSAQGRNFFYLASITASATGVPTTANAVTPLEAKGIDEKLDDGEPTSGVVESYTDTATADAGTTQTTSTCMDGTATPKHYNVTSAAAGAPSNPVCQLQIRTSF